jgi:hypothetical protein
MCNLVPLRKNTDAENDCRINENIQGKRKGKVHPRTGLVDPEED